MYVFQANWMTIVITTTNIVLQVPICLFCKQIWHFKNILICIQVGWIATIRNHIDGLRHVVWLSIHKFPPIQNPYPKLEIKMPRLLFFLGLLDVRLFLQSPTLNALIKYTPCPKNKHYLQQYEKKVQWFRLPKKVTFKNIHNLQHRSLLSYGWKSLTLKCNHQLANKTHFEDMKSNMYSL